jgi:alkylation response protein AidB-like acyl-CoA dehydrogenase
VHVRLEYAPPACVAGGDLWDMGTRARHWNRHAYPRVQGDRRPHTGIPMTFPMPSKIFTIFEGTSEIQRMLIGRAVTGLDVR